MGCPRVKECNCPKVTCVNYGRCCDCIKKHRDSDSLTYCLFPSKDKSVKAYYETLKNRFECFEEEVTA